MHDSENAFGLNMLSKGCPRNPKAEPLFKTLVAGMGGADIKDLSYGQDPKAQTFVDEDNGGNRRQRGDDDLRRGGRIT